MGESLDHCPPGWIGQSRKRCAQFIHNRMVVDYRGMSSVDFAIPPTGPNVRSVWAGWPIFALHQTHGGCLSYPCVLSKGWAAMLWAQLLSRLV